MVVYSYGSLTTMVLTDLGKSLGNVENVAVINMAVPVPSANRNTRQAMMNPQVEGTIITILQEIHSASIIIFLEHIFQCLLSTGPSEF